VNEALVKNFDECVKAGFPIIESSPRQCVTPSGAVHMELPASPNPTPASDPAPAPTPASRIDSGSVGGHVTIGPFCPVERLNQPCNPPADAYTSREAIVYAVNGVTIEARTHLDGNGNYKMALSPGKYLIQIAPAGIGPGEKKSFTIKSSVTTTVNFDIDTGIR
jgi:hypothetical protein